PRSRQSAATVRQRWAALLGVGSGAEFAAGICSGAAVGSAIRADMGTRLAAAAEARPEASRAAGDVGRTTRGFVEGVFDRSIAALRRGLLDGRVRGVARRQPA